MATRLSLDDKLAAIRKLRGQPLSPEQKAELRKRIGDRSNLVVAAAAAIAGENTLVELARDLEAAFDRFLVNPLKDDKLCRAKIAIIQALDKMEHQDPDVFQKAARHVQLEPVWGGTEDSAAPLRAAAIIALARIEGSGSLPLLVDAMTDPAKDVRIAAAMALGAVGDRGRGLAPPPQGPHRRPRPRRPLRVPLRPPGGRSQGEPRRSSPSSSSPATPPDARRRPSRWESRACPRRSTRSRRAGSGLASPRSDSRSCWPSPCCACPPPSTTCWSSSRRTRRDTRSRPCRPSRSTTTTRACASGSRSSSEKTGSPTLQAAFDRDFPSDER